LSEDNKQTENKPTSIQADDQEAHLDDYKDAIELMFFAYRDFISDPDLILSDHGFGRAHHRVLHFVGYNPGLSIAELLEILQVTKQSLARILRDLIDMDYIRQEIGDEDRRKRLLYLSKKGRELHKELLAPQINRFANVLQTIGPEKFSAWKDVMRGVISERNKEAVDGHIERARKEPTDSYSSSVVDMSLKKSV
jgi:DNA-binding MarR family transcriptional regulator